MDKVIINQIDGNAKVYVDDMVIKSHNKEALFATLKNVSKFEEGVDQSQSR